ncbi:hypothetical protein BGZ94_009797 [Podila epigama]|nr:hypothetical protein BGZ94_009797 [Podila epigama]
MQEQEFLASIASLVRLIYLMPNPHTKLPLFFLALAALTCAFPMIIKRSFPIVNIVEEVTTAVKEFNQASKAFVGDTTPCLDAADKIIAAIAAGQLTAEKLGSVTFLDAPKFAALLPAVSTLYAEALSLIAELTARVPEIAKAGQCKVAQKKLADVVYSGKFIIVILGTKIPAVKQTGVKMLSNAFEKLHSAAHDLLSEKYCVDAAV